MKTELETKIRESAPNARNHYKPNLLCEYCGEYHATIDESQKPCKVGRPLNLQDVLIALQPYWNNTKGKLYLTNVSDALYFEKEAGDHLARYDLTKDFHNQKPELYEFLSTLLNE